jgi:hypothetical protein
MLNVPGGGAAHGFWKGRDRQGVRLSGRIGVGRGCSYAAVVEPGAGMVNLPLRVSGGGGRGGRGILVQS